MKGRLAKKILTRARISNLFLSTSNGCPYSAEQISKAVEMRFEYYKRKHKYEKENCTESK